MAPDLAHACPSCGAASRPGAPWCTQCFLDLRPAPAVPPAEPADGPDRHHHRHHDRQDGQPLDQEPAEGREQERTWPCATCGTAVPLQRDGCAACGAGFLAELRAAEPPLLVLPLVGDLTRLSRVQRVAAALAGVLAVAAAVLAAGSVVS